MASVGVYLFVSRVCDFVLSSVCRDDLSFQTDGGAKASHCRNESDQLCQELSAHTVNGVDSIL